jgi:hypothetical protein
MTLSLEKLKEQLHADEIDLTKVEALSLIAALLAAQTDNTGLAIKLRDTERKLLHELTRAEAAEAALKEAREEAETFRGACATTAGKLMVADRALKETREGLRPFALISDLYDDREDKSFELWKDMHEPETRVTLGECRQARALLSKQDSGERP